MQLEHLHTDSQLCMHGYTFNVSQIWFHYKTYIINRKITPSTQALYMERDL